MIRILCFGDSNTWGFRPDQSFQRYSHDVRWTGVLQEELGELYVIIEEGLKAVQLFGTTRLATIKMQKYIYHHVLNHTVSWTW